MLFLICVLVLAVFAKEQAVFIGRFDVPLSGYNSLLDGLNQIYDVVQAPSLSKKDDGMKSFEDFVSRQHFNTSFTIISHSMTDAGIIAQDFAASNESQVKHLILISGFLQRKYRPALRECMAKSSITPRKSLRYPLGYLKDGVHDCYGDNSVEFNVPVLSIGGSKDGIVRVSRIAEAFYTQQVSSEGQAVQLPVIVIDKLTHSSIIDGETSLLSESIKSSDLVSDLSVSDAVSSIVDAVSLFASAKDIDMTFTTSFLQPFIDMFVHSEASWFFTGFDDEHGSSPWAALAQRYMAEPLESQYNWNLGNEFHLLSDEDKIPPYYREKHRPSVSVRGNTITTSTVAQLRYVEISPAVAAFGLNGDAIIEEEKINVLGKIEDNGSGYVSAIEIATKISSRQLIYNATGVFNPADTLDSGNRCAMINQKAFDLAFNSSSLDAQNVFTKFGKPIAFQNDTTAVIPAGPWWIWSYLEYKETDTALEVTSYKAFYDLKANPYGRGNHYCKLISPARVLEWIYLDGLRGKLGLAVHE